MLVLDIADDLLQHILQGEQADRFSAAVTHDRHVLDKVTTKVLEIDRGSAYLHVPEGWHAGSGYAAYLAGRAEREERAEAAEAVRKNLAARELAWLRRGAPARTHSETTTKRRGARRSREEALRESLPSYYTRAVIEHDVDVIAPPEIDITAGRDAGAVRVCATFLAAGGADAVRAFQDERA